MDDGSRSEAVRQPANMVTAAGFEKLTTELTLLRAKREALIGRDGTGRATRDAGGATDTDPDELARLDRRIAALAETVASTTIVSPALGDGVLGVGERVRVSDRASGEVVEYELVGTGEADPAAGRISYTSPVGAALLGGRAGDVIEVQAPGSLLRFEILAIEL